MLTADQVQQVHVEVPIRLRRGESGEERISRSESLRQAHSARPRILAHEHLGRSATSTRLQGHELAVAMGKVPRRTG